MKINNAYHAFRYLRMKRFYESSGNENVQETRFRFQKKIIIVCAPNNL